MDAHWTPPLVSESDLHFYMGESVLAQFVAAHDPPAVLRELVQNEYDASGRTLEVAFGADMLRVRGTGRTIDAAGWKRLSLMLGTGLVHATGERVQEKLNGIGSKNFGLRSLFLFGDRIFVRSGGRQIFLDRFRGTPTLLKDASSRGAKGAHLCVPYRVERDGVLPPFGIEQEAAAFDALASGLAPTLIKLAQPGRRNSLETIIVSSERLDWRLVWKQSVEVLRTRVGGVKAFRRTIRLRDSRRSRPHIIEELEFQQEVERPADFAGEAVPGYFVRQGRILVGVSVRMRRDGLDPEHRGTFFYPLGLPQGLTGTAVSVNAPFQLDGDRTQLLAGNTWNEWLLDRATQLATMLLKEDWIDRFGAAAFHAVSGTGPASPPLFQEGMRSFLKTDTCWPSRKRVGDRPAFVRASHLIVPEAPELDGFIVDPLHHLDERLSSDAGVRKMVLAFGAGSFTLNSLVRLRCGPAVHTLQTKPGPGQANYCYTDFPSALKDPRRQVQFGRALDAHAKRLSPQNWHDLKRTPSTLTGAGTLAAAESLLAVPEEFLAIVDVPAEDRLHPDLLANRVIRSIGKVFKPHDWARDVAERVRAGRGREPEREALYRFLLARPEALPRKLRDYLRQTAVLKDHAGAWACPADLLRRGAAGAELLAPVLRFPHADVAAKPELGRAFRFRQAVSHTDVLAFARLVESEPDHAAAFERVLRRWHRQLPDQAVDQLRGIGWCRTSRGDVLPPEETYLDNAQNRACLGEDVPYAVASLPAAVLERLGCRRGPHWRDVTAYLEGLQETGHPLSDPDLVYPALLASLRADRVLPAELAERRIVWTGERWATPADTLVGRSHGRTFAGVVPLLGGASAAVADAVLALGAVRSPAARHWRALLVGIASRYAAKDAVVRVADREALAAAYENLKGALPDVGPEARIFLDRDGQLHPPTAVAARTYLIDDDPSLAAAIVEARMAISFALSEPRALAFLLDQGVERLTAACTFTGYRVGAGKEPPPWLPLDRTLARLHDPAFASAVGAYLAFLARKRGERGEDVTLAVARRLRAVASLSYATDIQAQYRVSRNTVLVPRRFAVEKGRVVFAGVRTKQDFADLVSRAVAQVVTERQDGIIELADPLYRLLDCDDAEEMRQYLTDRGIPWSAKPVQVDTKDAVPEEHGAVGEPLQQALGEILALSMGAGRAVDGSTPLPAPAPPPPPTPPHPTAPEPRAAVSPPVEVESTRPVLVAADPEWRPTAPAGPRDPRRGGSWSPPSQSDVERDRALGRRGEEIVLRMERERLRAAGLDESLAVWQSATDEGADHDVRSVDEDGGPIWIEVKATRGRSGRFQWSGAELQLAIRERGRYLLYRVYDVNEAEPVVKCFRDPVGLLLAGSIRISLASLYGEVEPG